MERETGERNALPTEQRDTVDTNQYARWWLQTGIGGFRIRALYDPGAARTVMNSVGLQIASAVGKQLIPYAGPGARLANGKIEPIVGHVELPFDIAGERRYLDVVVMNELDADCLLGADFIRAFNAILLPRENQLFIENVEEAVPLELCAIGVAEACSLAAVGLADVEEAQRKQLQQLLDEMLPPIDAPLGCTQLAEHEIDVGGARPIKQRYYPVSQKIEQEMHAQVQKMLEGGIIQRSTSEWSSPVVMVRKSNGTYRFCVDYRKLNAVSKTSAYPLPYMEVILRKLQRARYISTLDLSSAYHQIPMKQESKPLTAFTVPGLGLFEFNRMPYGVVGGPSVFQELIDKVIGSELEPYAFSYLDDVIIVTETFEEHLRWLRHVLKRIADAGLTINREKSEFCRSEVKYLGVLVNRDGFRPDPDKIAPIMDYPVPKNLKQLRRFLGMASWYRKFLENFATIAEPLTSLTKKGVKYEWSDAHRYAFEQVKALVASAPVLHRPSFEHQFIIHTDASDTGLGAVLTQSIDGEERVLSFASRTLSAAERNYSVTERECLAVLWAVQKFRSYVEGYKFKVITDHSSLKWLCNLRNPSGRLARWALRLQGFDYEIEHRKGSLNLVPDALSRMYEDETECEIAAFDVPVDTQDEWYIQLLAKIREHPLKNPDWKLVGGRLYTYRPDPSIDDHLEDEDAWKLAIPLERRNAVLNENHDEPSAGHLGRTKTYQRLARYYYWPTMHKDVAEYVRKCRICQQCKVSQQAPAGLMGRRVISHPWEIVAGDVMGPFPRSTHGYEYLLIFMDLFTRWIECIPIRKANAQTIRRELDERIFMRFGLPEVFHSDNGTEFKNAAIEKFLKERGVVHSTIPPYWARANPVERVNRTVKTMITSFIEANHKTWDAHIPELMFAYNTAVQESTGVSPAFLNMGRNPIPPNTLRRQEDGAAADQESSEAVEKWRERMQELPDLQASAAERAAQAQARQAEYYDSKRRPVLFAVGDKVLKRNRILSSAAEGIAAKLAPKYAGPFTISAQLGSNVVEITDPDGKPAGKIHVNDLKPFHEDQGQDNEEIVAPEEEASKVGEKSDNRAPANDESRETPSVSVDAPRKRGRPRETRVIVKRATAITRTDRRERDVFDTGAKPPEVPIAKARGRPKGSKNLGPATTQILEARTRSRRIPSVQ